MVADDLSRLPHQLPDARPGDVGDRNAGDGPSERAGRRPGGRALGHDGDASSALVTGEAASVLLKLTRLGQRPASLGLDDEVQPLRLNLDVCAACAALSLLETDGAERALLDLAVCLLEQGPDEGVAAGQSPPEAVGHVVLMLPEEVEDRPDRTAMQR